MHDAKASVSMFRGSTLTHDCNMYYKGQETLERTAATDASVWSSPWRLAAVELRRSLGQKRRDAFLRIHGARYISDRLVFDFHLLV